MGQTNDKRVSREPSRLPDYSRDDTLRSSLDNLFEEDLGMGYSEITYISGVFTSKIETWVDNTKLQKRTETNFTYAPIPFVGTVIKDYYADDGVTINFKVTATLSYNANKTVNNIDVTTLKLAGP
jgi:hypothetical protein